MSKEQYNELDKLIQQELKEMKERKAKMAETLKDCGRALDAIIRMDKIAYPEYWVEA